MGTLRDPFERTIGRYLLGGVVLVVVLGEANVVVGGTDFLVWAGLSPDSAGTLTTGLVVLGAMVGLGAYAGLGGDR